MPIIICVKEWIAKIFCEYVKCLKLPLVASGSFYERKPSWNLVLYSILQVVDAFYASLQIRCTAHKLRRYTAKYRKSLSKSSV